MLGGQQKEVDRKVRRGNDNVLGTNANEKDIGCLLFVVRCSLFVVRCSLFVVRCL